MDENKTGVWVQNEYGTLAKLKQSSIYPINTNDRICIMTSKSHVTCEVKRISYYSDSTRVSHYYLNPVQSIYGAGLAAISPENTTGHLYIMVHLDDGTLVLDGDLIEEYLKCDDGYLKYGYVDSNTSKIIILPKRQETMNENLEIHTGTILADEMKIDTLTIPPLSERRVSALPLYQQAPITATSEAIKNEVGELSTTGKSWMIHDDRGLSPYAPTHIDWNGEMSATLTFSSEKLDEIMSELTGNEEEKDMNTEKLKDKIKKVIYVDKEMTVREPVLDSNGKPLERGGKPVTKAKFYKGMVKVVWNCGTETVAYTSRFDRFNREEGFKTCVLKYLFGNAGAYDAVDFWTNKYVKYPSSCIEVTENLCKLEEIIENDKQREEERKGLPYAKFLRRTVDRLVPSFSDDKLHYTPEDEKLANEFKKLAKKYFPELKCREIYINDRKQEDVFVAIK